MSEATKQINTWLHQETDGARNVRIPDLTDTIIARLLKRENRKLLTTFLRECIRPLVYDFAGRFCARTRGRIQFGDELTTPENVEKAIRKLRPRWESWWEHVGDRHVRLVDMTADDLRMAAAERRARGDIEYRYADVWESMADGMRPGQTVGQAYAEERLVMFLADLRPAA